VKPAVFESFESELRRRLEALKEQNLLRKLRCVSSPQQTRITIDGRELINFSSNDYLGLATHPKLKAAAVQATQRFGTGSGASRLISGSLQPHHHLEEALATFKRTEAALVFTTGYATAIGTITALAGKDDIIVLDKLVHASIVDAAKLSGATLRVFHHNDLNNLEAILHWTDTRRASGGNVLIVTESIFSMDGDSAPLKDLVNLKEKHGAWLMVDEAHATGLFGPNLAGLADQFGLGDQIEIQMGTLGKALGSAGGYIAGSRTFIEYVINKARSFVFSTAPPPAISAAAQAALQIVQSPEGVKLIQNLRRNVQAFGRKVGPGSLGPGSCRAFPKPAFPHSAEHCPILPLILGDEAQAVKLADALRQEGIFVPAIRYPSVARGKARLRFTLSSAHTAEDITTLERALNFTTQNE